MNLARTAAVFRPASSSIAKRDLRLALVASTVAGADASMRQRWGIVGRAIAERRFDAARQSLAVLELIAASNVISGRRHNL
jgi:lauroyl/myristoyl acyltransferase